MKRIGDILTRNKTRVAVEDGISYKQVTIRTNYKGVVLRGVQDGAAIGTKEQFCVSAGQFILSRIDARNGAFGIIPAELERAIVTNDFLAFDINENEVEIEFFNVFLQSPIFLDACIKASRGNTNRKRVDEDFFLNYEVNLPSLREQQQLIKRINTARTGIETAQHEITRQQSLLAKLKQAIRQEAIQGQLTVDWRAAHPDVEPASRLLQRIRAEKARLITAKQLRPEKPLPKITLDEIPFEIPKGWEWTRLGEVCEKTGSGSTPSGGKTAYSTMGIPFLRSQNVHDDGLVLNDVACISTAIHVRMKGTTVYPQDILLNITGGSIGRCALVSDEIEEANVNQHVAIIRPLIRSSGNFLHTVILSPYFQNKVNEAQTGAGREGLPKNKMDRILIPLPSLVEQKAIVKNVEALMTVCRTLETEIEHARTHASHLLQAVLREAFSGQPAALPKNEKSAPVNTKVIPFPVRIANISTTDLHAGILARAYQHHEQHPKHLIHFGHVKAEKIAHLVEAHLGIDLERMPVKAAAGPNDYPHLKKVESRAWKANWFVVRQQKADGAYLFHKEHGFDLLLAKTAKALGERAPEVDALINLLLPSKTRQAEFVATLYAAWNNLLLLGRSPSDEDIVYEARENWHPSKLEIEREKFFKALEWMRKQGLMPVGRGRYVDTK